MVQKIIVIDDDPTGNQTVHSCPLLTRWTPEVIREGLDDASSLLFILSNTRSLDASAAAAVMQEICRNLKKVLADGGVTPLFVSRSDSTLRGMSSPRRSDRSTPISSSPPSSKEVG